MSTITSKDGTHIAFDKVGQGPAVILVDGAMAFRAFFGLVPLAEQLADHFTAYTYDRRGRGESSDAALERGAPYAVEPEIGDIEALIQDAGGSAFLFGISSGAALVLEAAIRLGEKIRKIALYEPPYRTDVDEQKEWNDYVKQMSKLLAAGRRGDAAASFMKLTGASDEDIEGARRSPMWPTMEAVAPTLGYDNIAILGEYAAVPAVRAASVTVPALIMNGSASYSFMGEAAKALAQVIPNAQYHILEGQTHDVAPEVLAPVLVDFFK